ncbi:MAG: hypothetical protein HY926_05730 [Elusimicrobia bacterium]|nr:hypothetical protein [Elusimicrobiota bacterium]
MLLWICVTALCATGDLGPRLMAQTPAGAGEDELEGVRYVLDGGFLDPGRTFRAPDLVATVAVLPPLSKKDPQLHQRIRQALRHHLRAEAEPLMDYLALYASDPCRERHVRMNLDRPSFPDFYQRAVVAGSLFSRACSDMRRRDHQAARRRLDEAIHLDPRVLDAYRHRAVLESLLGQDEAAGLDYAEGGKALPGAPPARAGECRCFPGFAAEARHLERRLRQGRELKEAGIALYLKGQLAAAADRFSGAVSRAPADLEAYQSRAVVREALGDPAGALADYAKVVALSARRPEFRASALWNLSRLRERNGDLAGARRDLRQGLSEAQSDWPQRRPALRRLRILGMRLLLRGSLSEAGDLLRGAPGGIRGLFTAAGAAMRRGGAAAGGAARRLADPHHAQFALVSLLLAALVASGIGTAVRSRFWRLLPRDELIGLLACLALAAVVRACAQTFPSDAVLASSQGSYIGPATHRWGPAFSALLHLLYLFAPGNVETVARLNVVVGTLTAALVFAFTAAYFEDRLAAFSAAAVLACQPVLARYSASDSNFVLLTFCLFLACLFMTLWSRRGPDSLLLQAIGWMAVAANIRGEAVSYAAVLPLILVGAGGPPCRAKLARSLPAVLVGGLLLLYPAGILLTELFSAQGHRGFISPLGLAQAFFLSRHSPSAIAGAAVLGAVGTLAAQPRRAACFLLALAVVSLPTGFQARADTEILHRHVLPHLAAWCVFAGCGFSVAAALCGRLRGLAQGPPPWAAAAVLAFVLAVSAPCWGFLTKTWTHALEYEFIAAHLGRVPEDCLMVAPAVEGTGLFITPDLSSQVGLRHRWLAAARLLGLPADRCAVFYRAAACRDRRALGWSGGEHPACRGLSERFDLEPLWTASLPALPYAWEDYGTDPVPVGFYRIKAKRPSLRSGEPGSPGSRRMDGIRVGAPSERPMMGDNEAWGR